MLSLEDGFRPTYVNVESKCECDSELMDFLRSSVLLSRMLDLGSLIVRPLIQKFCGTLS